MAQNVDEDEVLEKLDKQAAPPNTIQTQAKGARELQDALRRIAQNTTDADALSDAGNAALLLGDPNAALNFFTRAASVQPSNGRIKAGLATATVRTENPFEALRLFDEAVKLGVSERTIAADRAMAYDLLGNFERAQQDYRLARTAASPDELVIRQAISLSLLGQKNDADAMLLPFLQKNDPNAWRARAFMLAARGDMKESQKVAQGFLSAASAERMDRYLRLMPQLTGAQQAAAIHLGHFPANNIGRDSEQVRRVAASIPATVLPTGEGRLIPSGNPLGPNATAAKPDKESKQAKRVREKTEKQAAIKEIPLPTVPQIKSKGKAALTTDIAQARINEAAKASATIVTARDLPVPETARPLVKVAMAVPSEGPKVITAPSAQTSVQVSQPTASNPTTTTVPEGTRASETPGFSSLETVGDPKPVNSQPTTPVINATAQGPLPGANMPPSPQSGFAEQIVASNQPETPSVSTAALPPTTPQSAPPSFDLAAVVGSIEIPESEQQRDVVAVDLKKIKPAVPVVQNVAKIEGKAEEKGKKPKIPQYPARYWVQIATGASAALNYDYKGWSRKKADLFKGRSGWTSPWGKSARLLVGTFSNVKEANKWEADFRTAGGKGFVWKSDDGTVVEPLAGK